MSATGKLNSVNVEIRDSNDNNLELDLVSVITPCYNSSRFISQAIESVLAQTYKNFEMIIVDDCSTDDSVGVVEEYLGKDCRIKLIKLEKNGGPAIARNIAIEAAKGGYIAFLDSDDIWLPEKLEKQIKFMKECDVILSYSSYYLINENGDDIGLFLTKERATYRELLKSNYIGNLTAIYDAGRIGKQYMEVVQRRQDYTLWLKILKAELLAEGILEPLAKYRRHRNSISSNKLKAAHSQWNVYRNIEKMSLHKCIYYFINYIYYGSIKYKKI